MKEGDKVIVTGSVEVYERMESISSMPGRLNWMELVIYI